MRITVDANILVRAAIRPSGPAGAVFEIGALPDHRLVLSRPMLTELRRVLGYERIRRLSGITPDEAEEFVTFLFTLAEIVEIHDIPAVCSDPDDDIVVATAVAGHADVLCTLVE